MLSPRFSIHFVLSIIVPMASVISAVGAPINVYLTYNGDTSRSITVNYHVEVRLRNALDPVVRFDSVSRGGTAGAYARTATGVKSEIPEFPEYRTINAVDLRELEPDTVYYFVAGDEKHGYTEERSFRTIPAGNESIRFVTGGDMGVTPLAERLLAQAGALDPRFCAIGGDIAYVNGQIWNYMAWDQWFANYDTHMRAPDGRMIPMLVAIGNHETNDFPTKEPAVLAPFYYYYFAQPQASGSMYFTRQFGADILFFVLDSGHVVPHGGEQSAWLAEALAANAAMKHTFALYHVPLYPSHRPYNGGDSVAGRVHWEPFFSAFELTAGFENHDHKLKRAKRLLNGEPNEEGVLYLGDGCFGVEPRDVPPEDERPYLDHVASIGHIWLVDVNEDSIHYQAIGETGEVLDEYRQEARERAPAMAAAAR